MIDDLPSSHANWLTQLKRGLLELCTLNLLAREPMYGYQLVKRVTSIPGMALSEGTIYPLLSRLKSQGFLTSTLIESPQGPARRTYVLTDAGHQHLAQINHAWEEVMQAVQACRHFPERSRPEGEGAVHETA